MYQHALNDISVSNVHTVISDSNINRCYSHQLYNSTTSQLASSRPY